MDSTCNSYWSPPGVVSRTQTYEKIAGISHERRPVPAHFIKVTVVPVIRLCKSANGNSCEVRQFASVGVMSPSSPSAVEQTKSCHTASIVVPRAPSKAVECDKRRRIKCTALHEIAGSEVQPLAFRNIRFGKKAFTSQEVCTILLQSGSA